MVSILLSCSGLSDSKNGFVVLLCLSLLLPFSLAKAAEDAPAIEWDRTYGAISAIAVFSTADDGYTLAGTTGDWLTASHGGGSWTNETLMLIKTDAAGDVQWRKNYTKGIMRSAVLTIDGGYALAKTGETNLMKTDSQGNVHWNKTYAAFADAFVSSMIQTSDDGYAIVGYGDHPLYGTESRLVKTDSNGNLLWNKTYGEPNESSIVLSIVQADDGGYALAGSTRGDMWLVKTDSNGYVQWEEMYGGENIEGCSFVVRTSDGGYLLAGYTASFGAGDEDCWVVKVDSHGKVQWEQTYGTSGRDRFTSVAQAINGGYILVGITDILGDFSGVVIKLSGSGQVEWEKSFAGDNNPESVTVASSGGYIFAGYKGEPTNRDSEVWAVKIAPDLGTQDTESLYTIWIAVGVIIVIVILGLGLLVNLLKRNR